MLLVREGHSPQGADQRQTTKLRQKCSGSEAAAGSRQLNAMYRNMSSAALNHASHPAPKSTQSAAPRRPAGQGKCASWPLGPPSSSPQQRDAASSTPAWRRRQEPGGGSQSANLHTVASWRRKPASCPACDRSKQLQQPARQALNAVAAPLPARPTAPGVQACAAASEAGEPPLQPSAMQNETERQADPLTAALARMKVILSWGTERRMVACRGERTLSGCATWPCPGPAAAPTSSCRPPDIPGAGGPAAAQPRAPCRRERQRQRGRPAARGGAAAPRPAAAEQRLHAASTAQRAAELCTQPPLLVRLLCGRRHQRPQPQPAQQLGTWQPSLPGLCPLRVPALFACHPRCASSPVGTPASSSGCRSRRGRRGRRCCQRR